MATVAPTTIGPDAAAGDHDSATGTAIGSRSALTEMVALIASPSHTARRTVTSSRHWSTSSIVSVAKVRRDAVGRQRAR